MQPPASPSPPSAATPAISFERMYGLNLRIALSGASHSVVFNDIFVATYPVLQLGLARALDADPTGRSLNCVQQAFAVWVATGDSVAAMTCFTQAQFLLLQVTPALKPHLPALLQRFVQPKPAPPAVAAAAPPASGPPPPSVLTQPAWIATARPAVPAPPAAAVVTPEPVQTPTPPVASVGTQMHDNSLRFALRGFRFESSAAPKRASSVGPETGHVAAKRPIADQQLARSDEETERLVVDDCDDSSRADVKRRSVSRLFIARQARHSPRHALRPSAEIQHRVAVTSGQCTFRGCLRRIPLSGESLCRLLYERTHWKCYMCAEHALHYDADSVRRCYNCAHDDHSKLVDVPVKAINYPDFKFTFTLCDSCLTFGHVKNQLHASREYKRPDVLE